MTTTGNKPTAANTIGFLKQVRDFNTFSKLANENGPYSGLQDFFLKEAVDFTPGIQPELMANARYGGPAKQCFLNSYQFMLMKPSLFTYCEGFAFNGMLPRHHAWVVDHKGRVYECTSGSEVTAESEYFGIPFELDFILERVKKTDTLGLLAWPEGLDLLETKLPDTAVALPWRNQARGVAACP